MNTLTIINIDRSNWRAALALGVSADQQRFISGYSPIAAIVLAKAYVGANGLTWQPYLFAVADEPIGMAALAYEPGSPNNYWLYHFFIDQHQQGHGYGRQAMKLLLAQMATEHPDCHQLYLTVHPENIPAQRLYRSVGFQPTGQCIDGEPVYCIALAPPINTTSCQ